MRKIYLIRHSQPNFPDGKKMCIGKTDLPLSTVGKMQSVLLAEGLKECEISAFYCSDLKRGVETASCLTENPIQKSGFQEFDCGEWDGFSFDEIRMHWPEVYKLRGEDLSYPIPGAESVKDGKKRFEKTLQEVLSESEGNIAIVGHATANRTFLCGIKGIDPESHRVIPMDYASVTTIGYDGTFIIEKENESFVPELTEKLCKELLNAAGTPEHVQAHCMSVKEQAVLLCKALRENGIALDEYLVETSAMLHDIARTQKDHAKCGEAWMQKLGYSQHGTVIGKHHDVDFNIEEIDEAAVLAMADRCVKETEIVPIEIRFAESKKKCKTEEALKMHELRYRYTILLRDRINELCGKEIIL